MGATTYDTTIGGSITAPSLFVDGIEHKGSCS
jgi:glutaredoxin